MEFDQARTAARRAVEGYFTGKLLGTPVYASALSHLVFADGLVRDCVAELQGDAETVAADALPVLDSLEITEEIE